MHSITIGALFALQCFHVLFLALHDWIPLGSLNDVKAVRTCEPNSQIGRWDADQPHSLCDWTLCQCYPLWRSLSVVVGLVALDQL